MEDRSGQQIDHYRLLRLLGRGNFGEVYLGENIHRKTQVAVKVLRMHLSKDVFFDFINEARIFRLRHPHIVSVLDFGVERSTETPFIVMDYAPNGTLRQSHAPGTRVSLAMVVEYAKQLAAALQYAHDENLIHRDVKPENMLVGANNEILLSDFGIAIVTQSMRTSLVEGQGMAGTPTYMAPEQWQGKPSRASDQYALGVIVYEWLSGQRLFTGTLYELMGQHMQVSPPPLSPSIPLYSPELEKAVMKALTKDPKSRFATVQEFAASLEEAYNKTLVVSQTATIHPKTKEQWLEVGNTYAKAERYKDAIAAYTRAIELDPNYATAYNNRGDTYEDLRQFQQALADYNRAIELKPNDATVYFNRGNVYRKLRQFQKALADYSRSIELDPNDAISYFKRGTTYRELQEYQHALADYTHSIELDPNDAITYFTRGNIYRRLQEYQQALADYTCAIELDPNNAYIYRCRSIAYYHLQQYLQAIADLTHAIELDPNYAITYNNRGYIYEKLQVYQRAFEDYDRALVLNPDDSDIRENRERARRKLKQS
jgi:serine/threonine protein kinase